MGLLRSMLAWGKRLPLRFSLVFAFLLCLSIISVGQMVSAFGAENIADLGWRVFHLRNLAQRAQVQVFWEGFVIVTILVVVVLAVYNVSAWISRLLPYSSILVEGAKPIPPDPGTGKRLDRFHKIGIILAGGGAKGSYQAGALRAIYEFLEENNALDKVKMIAGTSIGSWNAMFWLAGLVKPPGEGVPSAHEQWWREIRFGRMAAFDSYWPTRQSHFLLPAPWEKGFRKVFIDNELVRKKLAELFSEDPPIHFYFTRSNVELGQLEFSTNWKGALDVRPNLGSANQYVVKRDRCEIISGSNTLAALEKVQRAVFASMDLPPLMPYVRFGEHREKWFEDGGVVENVPVWFGTEIEGCDLLFILPLNASFSSPVNDRSVIARMYRVMDVRQGVLERNSLKMVYLYNELAELRNEVVKLRGAAVGGGGSERSASAAAAMRRTHEPVSVFSICPQQPLIIETAEFWKPKEAMEAFALLYEGTRAELHNNFEQHANPGWVRMALVNSNGERTWVDNF